MGLNSKNQVNTSGTMSHSNALTMSSSTENQLDLKSQNEVYCLSLRSIQLHQHTIAGDPGLDYLHQDPEIYYHVTVNGQNDDRDLEELENIHVFSIDGSDNAHYPGNCNCAGKIERGGKEIAVADCPARMHPQPFEGIRYDPKNYVMFMTDLIRSDRSAHVDIVVNIDIFGKKKEYLGTAKLFISSQHGSTHGQQRSPILNNNLHPIGEISADYLIVQNAVAIPIGANAQRFSKPDWLTTQIIHMAHRGAGTGVRLDLENGLLENTIASFNYAIDHGADFVELDLFVTRDGIPTVFHDFTVHVVDRDGQNLREIQCDELTHEELRALKFIKMQQPNGEKIIIDVDKLEAANKPFQTLEEVISGVRPHAGICIEFKWPQLLESNTMEAFKHRDINDYLDCVLKVVNRQLNNRPIILQTFEADLTILLRLKQNRHPVIFLSEGLTDHYEAYMDPRARNVMNGICFASALDVAGVNILVDYYLNDGKNHLMKFIHDHGMVAHAWGAALNSLDIIDRLLENGLDSMVYDNVDKVRATTV